MTPLLGGCELRRRFTYRPDWGLPGWVDGDQTGAPVLGFSRSDIQPGGDVRAIIVPPFPGAIPSWQDVAAGDELRMYEGPRICGHAIVAWTEPATWPMPEDDGDHLAGWLAG